MTDYLRRREEYFFQSYPAESIRLAERLQKKTRKKHLLPILDGGLDTESMRLT